MLEYHNLNLLVIRTDVGIPLPQPQLIMEYYKLDLLVIRNDVGIP
jgi:hypothetical protein